MKVKPSGEGEGRKEEVARREAREFRAGSASIANAHGPRICLIGRGAGYVRSVEPPRSASSPPCSI